MKHIVLALLWLVAMPSVSQDKPCTDGKSQGSAAQEDETFKIFPDPEGNEYFPEGTGSYYTRYLSAMKEPSLQRDLEELEEFQFRFTYLRSFDDPLMVRISKVGNTLKLRSVILKMGDNYEPIGVTHDKTVNIGGDEAKDLLENLQQREFWKPLNDAERFCEGLDGSRWVFEIRDKDGYRMVDPWSPDSNVVHDDIDLPKLLKDVGLKAEPVRDYVIYVDVGYGLLRMAGILPNPNLQY
ncbi:MAG: hypothetical protein JNJ70_03565 [Verrucomicrobiales bacterium]|nr:hypothetical protein [Verrucomicrobiales bacterium]